jgi:hypothetical protein
MGEPELHRLCFHLHSNLRAFRLSLGFLQDLSIYGKANFLDMDGDQASTGMILES